MEIYSIIETRNFCGGILGGNSKSILQPQVSILYSCTDANECDDNLIKIAMRYLKENERLKDFANKKGADYYFPDREGHYNVALYIKHSDIVFNSDHEDEHILFISGLYDRMAQLLIKCGEKTKRGDDLSFYIPVNEDMLEIAVSESSIETENGYEICGLRYLSYDNGLGFNGNFILDCVGLDSPVDISELSDFATCELANYVEWFYDRKMN